jgi:hypothetical protein
MAHAPEAFVAGIDADETPTTGAIVRRDVLFRVAPKARTGRRGLIASGLWMQAAGIVIGALSSTFLLFVIGVASLGVGSLLWSLRDEAHVCRSRLLRPRWLAE